MKIVLYVLLLFAPMAIHIAYAQNEFSHVKIGNQNYKIPKKYMIPHLSYEGFIPPDEQLDRGDGITLVIPFRDIGITEQSFIAQSSRKDKKIQIFISEPPSIKNEFNINTSAYQAWTAQGLYDKRIIEQDNELVRVYPKAGYPKFYEFFSVNPSSNVKFKESYWITGCIQSGIHSSSRPRSEANCDTTISIRGGQLKIRLRGSQLKKISMIKSSIKALVESWKY